MSFTERNSICPLCNYPFLVGLSPDETSVFFQSESILAKGSVGDLIFLV